MGREVRRVSKDWEHPKDEKGNYIPMHDEFVYNKEEIEEGLRDGWLKDDPPFYGCDVMPQWTEEEKTHYQMYENVTEGTPISPVFETPEELATWLVESGADSGAGRRATYEQWLRVCKGGFAPTFIMTTGPDGCKIESGVEYEFKKKED
jgi:hypothetical protein